MKKLVALLLVVMMFISGTALAEFPLTTEPVTLKFLSRTPSFYPGQDFENVDNMKAYEQMTGINIEYDNYDPSVFSNTLAGVIASGDLPDVIFRGNLSNVQLYEWGSQGFLVDLTPYLEEYAPNFTALMEKYPDIRMTITAPDGAIYGLPQAVIAPEMRVPTKMFINKNEDGKWVMYVMDLDKFFADANKNKAKDFDSYLTKLAVFPDSKEMGRPGGWCINSDDTYAYITVTREGTPEEIAAMKAKEFTPRDDQPKKVAQALTGLRKMNLVTGETSIIANMDFRVGHIQASRFRPNEIVFCCETGGDADQRMWYADADACTYKPLYVETPLDWVTHETFGTEDWVYFNVLGWQDRLRKQASGIFRINLRTDDVECLGNVEMDKDRSSSLTGRGFWHCNSTRDNKWAAGDTFAGSVWLINVETGHKYPIATDVKMAPDHAHPFFSPDGTKLCFKSGHWSDGKRLNLVMVDLTKLPFYNE